MANSAHNTSSPVDPVLNGVLVWIGMDRTRVARQAAHLLLNIAASNTEDPGDRTQSANIIAAWVRSFGPLGVVMYRFQATRKVMLDIRSAYEEKVDPKKKSERGDIQPYEVLRSSHNGSFQPVVIHRASEPWAARRDIPGIICWWTYSNTDANISESLERFLNILASTPEVDVAQFDQISKRGETLVALRVFDLGRRGEKWLRYIINRSCRLAHGGKPAINMCSDHAEPEHEDRECYITALNQFIAPDELFEQEASPYGYLYVAVHCADRAGAFADVFEFIRTHPSRPGMPRTQRRVIRSACRGLGDEGVELVEVAREKDDDPDWLQTELQRMLSREDKKARQDGRIHHTSQPLDDDWAGYWTAVVLPKEQEEAPYYFGFNQAQPFKINPKPDVGNLPGYLHSLICAMENTIESEVQQRGGNTTETPTELNVYYLDGRGHRGQDSPLTQSQDKFHCTFGVAVDQRTAQFVGRMQLKKQLDNATADVNDRWVKA